VSCRSQPSRAWFTRDMQYLPPLTTLPPLPVNTLAPGPPTHHQNLALPPKEVPPNHAPHCTPNHHTPILILHGVNKLPSDPMVVDNMTHINRPRKDHQRPCAGFAGAGAQIHPNSVWVKRGDIICHGDEDCQAHGEVAECCDALD